MMRFIELTEVVSDSDSSDATSSVPKMPDKTKEVKVLLNIDNIISVESSATNWSNSNTNIWCIGNVNFSVKESYDDVVELIKDVYYHD